MVINSELKLRDHEDGGPVKPTYKLMGRYSHLPQVALDVPI
jgi:hypothetical protein